MKNLHKQLAPDMTWLGPSQLTHWKFLSRYFPDSHTEHCWFGQVKQSAVVQALKIKIIIYLEFEI